MMISALFAASILAFFSLLYKSDALFAVQKFNTNNLSFLTLKENKIEIIALNVTGLCVYLYYNITLVEGKL